MKVIIENTCILPATSKETQEIFLELGRLAHWITFLVKIIEERKEKDFNKYDIEFIKELFVNINHFAYGFGSNHIWVHQKGGNKILPDRVIFVDFTE